MKSLFLVVSFSFCAICAHAQAMSLRIGANHNTTIQKQTPEISGVFLRGFDPKYGYQAALSYKQVVYKSLFLVGEIGYLNKGHQRISPVTKTNSGDVNYNYLFLAPSLGLDLPLGIYVKVGGSFNRLINQPKGTFGEVQKMDYAFSTALGYHYKKVGLELGYNKSIQPMQKLKASAQYEHYHRWLTASLTYKIFEKRTKTD
jgi:hypothetical protein